MQTVTSSDGTKIAFETSGSGPALVLVHGTSASSARWGNIKPLLEPHFTVYVVDRRGRGGSGDTPAGTAYDYRCEFADIAAVVEAAKDPVILFGHSYGGLLSLGAAGLTGKIAAMVLYEAPVSLGGGFSEDLLARMDAAVASGDRDTVLKIFCEEVVQMRASDIAALRASPAWPARLAAAHTIPRELRTAGVFALGSVHAERITAPTLLLHGADSPEFFKQSMARLAGTIPHAKTVALAGQQHVAMDTAPELLTQSVLDFWRGIVQR